MRFIIALLLCLLPATAFAQTGSTKSQAQLNTEIGTTGCSQPTCLYPDNTSGQITPFDVRQGLLDIVASFYPTGCGSSNFFMVSNGTTFSCRAIVGSDLPNPTFLNLGGVFALTPAANQVLCAIDATGAPIPCNGTGGAPGVTGQGNVVLDGTGGTTPTLVTPNFTTSFSVDNVAFGAHSTNYNEIFNRRGTPSASILVGNATDPSNIFENTFHKFTDVTGANNFALIQSGSLTIYNASGGGNTAIAARTDATTPTLQLPSTSGTFAVSASSPLSINSTTGVASCATCATTGGANIPSIAGAGEMLYSTAANTLAASFTPTLGTIGSSGTQGTLTFAGTNGTGTVIQSAASPGNNFVTLPATTNTTLAGLGIVETWTANQTFNTGTMIINGGSTTAGLATVTSGGVVSSEANATFAQGGTNATSLSGAQANLLISLLSSTPITVNFGVAGDNAIPITLPTGFTQVRANGILISQCTASLSGGTFGLFTTTGGGGAALVTAGATSTITNNTANTNNNFQFFNTFNNANTEAYTPSGGNLQFRVGATVSASCSVSFTYYPVP